MPHIIGWDIGGVHLKAASLEFVDGRPVEARARLRYFEMWREREALPEALRRLRLELGGGRAGHALTMTGELADCFASKAEGVRAILSAAAAAFGDEPLSVWGLDGEFASTLEAGEQPLQYAASNWLATAEVAAREAGDGLLLDVGSTTTDIVPFREGRAAPAEHDDTARLAAGELVYTGVLRTLPAALAPEVPLRGRWCRLSSEPFAFVSDVYLALGRIRPDQVTTPTADRRPATREAALARLARLVCADLRALGGESVLEVARFLESSQISVLERAARQVLSLSAGDPAGREVRPALTLVATGLGEFLAAELARRLGLPCLLLSDRIPLPDPQAAPATCVALLLARKMSLLETGSCRTGTPS